MSKSVQHLSIIKVEDEYGTKQEDFDNACETFAVNPRIDICASEANHVLKIFISKEQDVFKQFPEGVPEDFYMNPPYSEVKKFMKFAYESHVKNNVTALILTYAKTDTKFWHEYVEGKAEVHFIKGRLNFNDEHGNAKMIFDKKANKWRKGASPYPSVWLIYRSTKDYDKKVSDVLNKLEQVEQ
jgi:hypothetical protein